MKNKKIDIRTIDVSKLKVRSLDNGQKQISGCAVVFNQPSEDMGFTEYIMPHAIDSVDLSDCLLLYAHDYNQILARADSGTLKTEINDQGLFFTADLADTTLANDVYADIQAGNVKGCSFGFMIGEDDWQEDENGNLIHIINSILSISELSLTPIPAYTETSVQVARSLEKFKNGGKKMPKEVKEEPKVEEPKPTEFKDSQEFRDMKKELEDLKRDMSGMKMKDDDDKKNNDDKKKEDQPDDKAGKEKEREKPKKEEEEKRDMKILGKKSPDIQVKENIRSFEKYLKSFGQTRDTQIALATGAVLIPDTILPADHEQHQFARIADLVRHVSVSTTTGKYPMFSEQTGTLSKKAEFANAANQSAAPISTVPWDLQSFAGKFVYSQELLQDSAYDWQSELGSEILDLRDNTDDEQIMATATDGVTATTVSDASYIDAIRKVLISTLKPKDAQRAGIILSQSAQYALSSEKDTTGRPLINMDYSQAGVSTLFGKPFTVVDDTLFPSGKNGDINVLIAPFQKSIIKFENGQIQGKYIDNYDVFYQALGFWMRCDYVQTRKDLINWIQPTSSSSNAG